MTGRKSTRLQAQTADPIPAAVEEPRKGLKRKTPVSKNGDEPLQKATKARRLGKAKVKPDVQGSIPKTRAESKQTGQSYVPVNSSLGRISYLPPEVMNMIIDDKTCLKNLTMTSKALYSLAMPQLFKRIERSCGLHVHIAKLIKTTEPFLSIEQRKQLKKEDIYKGQQETFPDDVDPDKKPEISNYVRQILVETGDPGKKHRYIVYRYVEELLENLDNLELWGSWMLTEYAHDF
ncbi:hypothetical protein NW768_006837 [Fusarium equiseti]|uniref:F-box domain-containing protein n=1 Tax=Fusarium equiseti TaxID=61235 RepID=A0ABQ8R9B7_FUSEQ|nr:hypothetical protein NW768_006837 [Fusarium equiseti]